MPKDIKYFRRTILVRSKTGETMDKLHLRQLVKTRLKVYKGEEQSECKHLELKYIPSMWERGFVGD